MPALLALLLIVQPATSPDSTAADTVFYGGLLVRFLPRSEEVVLLDSAWVRYREMTVYGDSIHFGIEEQRLTASGDVLFTSGDLNVDGTMLQYDLDERKGMIRTARTEIESGFFRADEIWLVEENVINARRSLYTTCEKDPPHYAFHGPRAKLLVDDLVIVEPVVFRAFDIPLLAAPFWLVPVASRRTSGLLPFKVGQSSLQGWYASDLGYYWAFSEYADATFYCDVMTKKGIQPRFQGIYVVNPFARGNVNASYINEWDTRTTRYSVNARHDSRFFFGSDLSAAADIISDARYIPEYGEDRIDRLKQEAYSWAELNRRFGRVGRVTATAERRDLFLSNYRSTLLPGLAVSFGTQRLPFSLDLSPRVRFSRRHEQFADSTGADTARLENISGRASAGIGTPDYDLGPAGDLRAGYNLGLDSDWRVRQSSPSEAAASDWQAESASSHFLSNGINVSLSQRLPGAINTRQTVSADQRNDLSGSLPPDTRYRGDIMADLTLYRVFALNGFGLDGLLHTARTSAGMSYEPEVTDREYIGTPRLGEPRAARISLGLTNGFQARTSDSTPQKFDLGSAQLSTGYDIISRRPDPVRAGLRTGVPYSRLPFELSLDAAASFDWDSLRLGRDYRIATMLGWEYGFGRQPLAVPWVDTTRHDPQRDWRVRLGVNHYLLGDNNMLTGALTLYVPGWRFDLSSIGYNFTRRELTDYSITVWKDLHCWEALVNIEKLGSQWKYDFEFRIRQLQDIKLGKSTFRGILPE
ncbi:MAG: putative LPS assembly protein LptD [bacterium]